MTTAKVFQSGNSQAIRLPKEFQTDKKEFIVRRVGEGLLFCPADDPWFPLRLCIGQMPLDFMADREQPGPDDVPDREEL